MNINIEFIDYNSIVILTYLFLSIGALLLNIATRGKSNELVFSSYRSSMRDPMTYVRLIMHSIGHQNWAHLTGNFIYILLVGPMIEEKYGSANLLLALVATSVIVGIFNSFFSNHVICGASSNVYMLIVLSSFSNISEGKIPLTLIIVFLFYTTTELKDGIVNRGDHVYHFGHLLGAICGLVFGFVLLYHPTIAMDIFNYIFHITPAS